MLMDKRHVYDWDTRIHLLSRGPGIAPSSTWAAAATQVDMAPTFLGLAGVDKPKDMDGKSLVPLLLTLGGADVDSTSTPLAESTKRHLASLLNPAKYRTEATEAVPTSFFNLTEAVAQYRAGWRDSVFIEYYYVADNDKCVTNCHNSDKCGLKTNGTTPSNIYPSCDSQCGNLSTLPNSNCWSPMCKDNCYPTESTANNFIALRNVSSSNSLYAEFKNGFLDNSDVTFEHPDFIEYYPDLTLDPWHMNNIKPSDSVRQAMHDKLQQWYMCKGDDCP